MHGDGETPAVGESLGQGRSRRQVPQRAGNRDQYHRCDQKWKVGGSSHQGISDGGPGHAPGQNHPPLSFEDVHQRSPAQADQPGTHLPDTEQRCHLSVAEAKRLGDDRHEYRKSLIVKVGGAVPQRETGQDESTAAPALQGRLRYLIHCYPLFSCRIMRGGRIISAYDSLGESKVKSRPWQDLNQNMIP